MDSCEKLYEQTERLIRDRSEPTLLQNNGLRAEPIWHDRDLNPPEWLRKRNLRRSEITRTNVTLLQVFTDS